MNLKDNSYAKQKEPVTKGQTLHDSTHMKYLEQSKAEKRKVERWLPDWGKGRLVSNG